MWFPARSLRSPPSQARLWAARQQSPELARARFSHRSQVTGQAMASCSTVNHGRRRRAAAHQGLTVPFPTARGRVSLTRKDSVNKLTLAASGDRAHLVEAQRCGARHLTGLRANSNQPAHQRRPVSSQTEVRRNRRLIISMMKHIRKMRRPSPINICAATTEIEKRFPRLMRRPTRAARGRQRRWVRHAADNLANEDLSSARALKLALVAGQDRRVSVCATKNGWC